MTIEAKPVVRNKYWIVENNGQKIATVQAAEDGVVFVQDNHRLKYPSIKVLGTEHNIRFVSGQRKPTKSVDSVYDYPSRSTPYNAIYDLRLKLPLYTESRKSKSFYCAGYYLVQIGTTWSEEFCPKKIILTRNNYHGPFHSLEQAQEFKKTQLSTHK